jgi:hypothetical protein
MKTPLLVTFGLIALSAVAPAQKPYALAVIGDTPYGPVKLEEFPRLIALINADSSVDVAVHLGDIKVGTHAPCTDAYNDTILAFFNSFRTPLVYTPGDNEWADCHAETRHNGTYTPTERLQALRAKFFAVPGQTLGGRPMAVRTQASDTTYRAFVENVMWVESRVVFATLNVPGGNDDIEPWGLVMPPDYRNYPSQPDERTARGRANGAWVNEAFATATAQDAAGIVLMFQADMWDQTATLHGYTLLVRQIATLSAAFKRPVLLLEGDSHRYRVDQPFLADSGFRRMFRAIPTAENVVRVVVEGANGRTEYLRVTIDPGSPEVFKWERVPLSP